MATPAATHDKGKYLTKESKVKVWIEQDECTGDALCEELCPAVFGMGDDGLAHVKDGETVLDGGAPGAVVPAEFEEAVLDAQSQCAAECIYVEK